MKIPNTVRIYHQWHTWECVRFGMYERPTGSDEAESKKRYRSFLSDSARFQRGINRVFDEWPVSCENFLTNQSINRIAWIGQSAACIELSLSSCYKGGFWLLSMEQQEAANKLAFRNLLSWVTKHNENKAIGSRIRNGMGSQMLLEWHS